MFNDESLSFLKKGRARPAGSKELPLPRIRGIEAAGQNPRRRLTKALWCFLSGKNTLTYLAAGLGMSATPALAHAFLDGAVPRVGSEIPAAPAEVVLHFTQGVEPEFSKIEVQDSAGASVTTGAAHMAGDPTHFAVPLRKLPAGIYTVIWHVTSVDTHKTQGKFHFTVTQ
jgi:methionine-rich copper-binding protein CopC